MRVELLAIAAEVWQPLSEQSSRTRRNRAARVLIVTGLSGALVLTACSSNKNNATSRTAGTTMSQSARTSQGQTGDYLEHRLHGCWTPNGSGGGIPLDEMLCYYEGTSEAGLFSLQPPNRRLVKLFVTKDEAAQELCFQSEADQTEQLRLCLMITPEGVPSFAESPPVTGSPHMIIHTAPDGAPEAA